MLWGLCFPQPEYQKEAAYIPWGVTRMSLESFLKALETEGGKLMVIIAMLGFLVGIAMVLLFTGHTPQEAGREMLTGAISSLLGILYGYLKASGNNNNAGK